MLNINAGLIEQGLVVLGLYPIVPSSTTPDYVSMKGYERLTVVISVSNTTGVTGSAITLKQATNVTNSLSDEKAVSFDTVYANVDTSAGDTFTKTAVSSNTFTTASTSNKVMLYVIEVKAEDLDQANGFDCIRLGTGNSTNATIGATYILWPAKYGVKSAIVN